MRTCWVLDHPAHVRLMLPLLQKSGTRDLIIASNRAEIRQLLATAEGLLPTRELHWVERPVGRKLLDALVRLGLPQLDGLVSGAGDHQGALLVELQRSARCVVRLQQMADGAVLHVPHERGSFLVNRNQGLVERTPLHLRDLGRDLLGDG